MKTLHILYLNSVALCLLSAPGGVFTCSRVINGIYSANVILEKQAVETLRSGRTWTGCRTGCRAGRGLQSGGSCQVSCFWGGEEKVFGWSLAPPLICILFEFPACIIPRLMGNCSALPQLFRLSCLARHGARTARGGSEGRKNV